MVDQDNLSMGMSTLSTVREDEKPIRSLVTLRTELMDSIENNRRLQKLMIDRLRAEIAAKTSADSMRPYNQYTEQRSKTI